MNTSFSRGQKEWILWSFVFLWLATKVDFGNTIRDFCIVPVEQDFNVNILFVTVIAIVKTALMAFVLFAYNLMRYFCSKKEFVKAGLFVGLGVLLYFLFASITYFVNFPIFFLSKNIQFNCLDFISKLSFRDVGGAAAYMSGQLIGLSVLLGIFPLVRFLWSKIIGRKN